MKGNIRCIFCKITCNRRGVGNCEIFLEILPALFVLVPKENLRGRLGQDGLKNSLLLPSAGCRGEQSCIYRKM